MRMPLQAVDRDQTVESVEQLLRTYESLRDPSGPLTIQIPAGLSHRQFGSEAALAQLLITASRRDGAMQIRLSVAKEHLDVHLEKLARSPYGITALMMASDVTLHDGTSVRSASDAAVRRRIVELSDDPISKQRGERQFLACIDHSSRWAVPALYYDDGSVRPREEIVELTRDLVDRSLSTPEETRLGVDTVRSIGAVIHELFKNTHDWARTSSDGRRLVTRTRGSVRMIVVERHNGDRERLLESAGNSGPLPQYARQIASDDCYVPRILEISVFDSGPGLASRWLGRDASGDSIETEHAAVLACLHKHTSSSLSPVRGNGLDEVLRHLEALRGFVRVRTGRIAIFRDFTRNQPPTKEQTPTLGYLDWNTQRGEARIHSAVSGTCFTMLIPLETEGQS